jgi:uncharacterized protein YjbI with pentapeptide repeats
MLGIWIFIGAFCLGVVLILACYTIPQWLTRSYTFATAKEKADAVDANRKTLAQVLGGFALVVTFAWTVLKDGQTLDQGRLQLANQQFIEGAKLLKESNAGASAAGVHALSQVAIARTEFEPLVTDTLVSFIKSGQSQTVQDHKPFPNGALATIPANIQAAITVLASRPQNDGSQINLYGAYLVRAKFSVADRSRSGAFRGVNFDAAILHGAEFRDLDLSNARFGGSFMADWLAHAPTWTEATPQDREYSENVKHLFTVNFENANLTNVKFDNAMMGGANLKGANLKGASLWQTNLSRANLTEAVNLPMFDGAILTDAIFAGTDLADVEFFKAELHGTNFKGARNVNRAIFRDVCSDRAPLFNPGVEKKFPPCPK